MKIGRLSRGLVSAVLCIIFLTIPGVNVYALPREAAMNYATGNGPIITADPSAQAYYIDAIIGRPMPGPGTYVNDEYRFSVDYPPTWTNQTVTVSGGVFFAKGPDHSWLGLANVPDLIYIGIRPSTNLEATGIAFVGDLIDALGYEATSLVIESRTPVILPDGTEATMFVGSAKVGPSGLTICPVKAAVSGVMKDGKAIMVLCGVWPANINDYKAIGATLTFYPVSIPVAVTDNATGVTDAAATLRGTLSDDGWEPCQYRFLRGTSSGVYTENTTWSTGTITTGASFSDNWTTLTPSTKYYFAASCNNTAGEGVGAEKSFTTTAPAPVVTNASGASSIMATTAILHGNLTSDGGSETAVTIYGGTSDVGRGTWEHVYELGARTTGAFSLGVTGLTPGTPYYYRCSATNSGGTSWAEPSVPFTTQPQLGVWRKYWAGPGNDRFWFSSGIP